MPRLAEHFAAAALLLWCTTAAGQEAVHFPSLEDNGPGRSATPLDGYLFRPAGERKNPAVVFLHGCGGLFNRATGLINIRELDWARQLTQRDYVVLMVDSFGPRNQGEMCSQRGFNREVYQRRPHDAYGALLFLQAQPYVRPDRVGVVGWQGGGAILFSIDGLLLPRCVGDGSQMPLVRHYSGIFQDQLQAPYTSGAATAAATRLTGIYKLVRRAATMATPCHAMPLHTTSCSIEAILLQHIDNSDLSTSVMGRCARPA